MASTAINVAECVDQLRAMGFGSWPDKDLALAVRYGRGVEGALEAILASGDPVAFRASLQNNEQQTSTGMSEHDDFIGSRVQIRAPARPDINGVMGQVIEFHAANRTYTVRLDNGLLAIMDASVLQRHEMQVSEENILRVADACEHALELQKKGDIEGSISLLRSGLRPPSLWRRHAIGAASWAAFESALAAAFCDRIVGSRAANIEAALGHFESALLVFTIEDYPTQFAECSNGLATAYTERIEGEKAHNLESAIQHFHSALSVYTLQSFPERWAMVNSNLGTAFMERDEGDRADNYEVAIEHYQNALEVFTPQEFPEQSSMVHNNLATAYTNRINGERPVNLEMSVTHFDMALGGMRFVRESRNETPASSISCGGSTVGASTMRISEGSAKGPKWNTAFAREEDERIARESRQSRQLQSAVSNFHEENEETLAERKAEEKKSKAKAKDARIREKVAEIEQLRLNSPIQEDFHVTYLSEGSLGFGLTACPTRDGTVPVVGRLNRAMELPWIGDILVSVNGKGLNEYESGTDAFAAAVDLIGNAGRPLELGFRHPPDALGKRRFDVIIDTESLGFDLTSMPVAGGSTVPVVGRLSVAIEQPAIGDTLLAVNGTSIATTIQTANDEVVDSFAFAMGLIQASGRPITLTFEKGHDPEAFQKAKLVEENKQRHIEMTAKAKAEANAAKAWNDAAEREKREKRRKAEDEQQAVALKAAELEARERVKVAEMARAAAEAAASAEAAEAKAREEVAKAEEAEAKARRVAAELTDKDAARSLAITSEEESAELRALLTRAEEEVNEAVHETRAAAVRAAAAAEKTTLERRLAEAAKRKEEERQAKFAHLTQLAEDMDLFENTKDEAHKLTDDHLDELGFAGSQYSESQDSDSDNSDAETELDDDDNYSERL